MWEVERYQWREFEAYRDATRAPELLQIVLVSEVEQEWSSSLSYLEACASDLGAPCAMTPALVSCLVSAATRTNGKKRSAIVSVLEELTCGRGSEEYTEAQLAWLREATVELTYALKLWVDLLERSSPEDAEQCVDLLAYCAERVPEVAGRVAQYLTLAEVQHPQLRDEIHAVREYFKSNL